MLKKMLVADVAKHLDVTPATVRDMERRGQIPAERTVSGTRLFDHWDVERVAKERAAKKAREGR